MSSVGDIVLTEPVVAALRRARPESSIGFVVKERFRDLVRPNPSIDRIHALRGSTPRALLDVAREIRSCGYSTAIDLHSNPRSRFLSLASGAGVRTSYVKRDSLDSARVRLLRRPYRASRKIVERYLDALEPLGIAHPYARPRFHLDSRSRERARRMLTEAGLAGRRLLVLAPGSVWDTKRWPAERFGELARRLASEAGMSVVAVGSASERSICETVVGDSGGVSFAGSTGLGDMAALIAEAALFYGNDSGPTHISMALETPTVALFGPTDPGQFDFEGHSLLYEALPCGACSFFGGTRCRERHWGCMLGITVDDAFEAGRALMERRGRN